MSLQQLQQFKVASAIQHMTKATNTLFIAQPALSKTIKTLEEEFQAPLFDRIGKKIYTNENGKILLRYVNSMNEEIERMHAELTACRERENKEVTILLKATPMLVVGLVQRFRTQFPEVVVRLHTYNRSMIKLNLKYDFCIDSALNAEPNDHSLTLLKEDVVLAVPLKHRWAGKTIDLSEAAQEEFIGLPSFYPQAKEFDRLCKTAGFQPHVVLRSSDYYTIQGMVNAGVGIAIVPEYSWGVHKNTDIAFARIRATDCTNTIRITWEDDETLSETGKCFLRYMRNLVEHDEITV